jgi:copper chaperone
VTTLTNVINVEGMSCDHCKHSIEKALNGLENGVTSSEVSFMANGNVEVEFDENQVAFNDFKEAIEDQGYDVIK